MFRDIHYNLQEGMAKYRIPGATFDKVIYADDTICMSTDTRQLNQMLAEIEIEGKKYGMLLNKNKCEVVTNRPNSNIKFQDGTKVTQKEEVKYLGCMLNQKGNTKTELSKRISNAAVTMKKLDLFWHHSNCPAKFKILVIDSVLRSKVLYGMESAQINEPDLKRLETFQLKALRKVLKLKTTFVDRNNTNTKVYQEANKKLAEVPENIKRKHKIKEITTFKQAYRKARRKRMEKILLEQGGIAQTLTFQKGLQTWKYPGRRKGRPKYEWALQTLAEMWQEIRMREEEMRYRVFREDDEEIEQCIRTNIAKT